MELLEHFWHHPPQNETYLPRRIILPPNGRINLYGPRGCGKTAFVLEQLRQTRAQGLYIDLESPALIMTPLETLPLQAFIDENRISLLVLDHVEEGLIETFPRVERLIAVSRRPLQDDTLSAFSLALPDFNEFIALHPSLSSDAAFKRYLRFGALPALIGRTKSYQEVMKRFFQHQFTPQEQSLMLILARYNTQPLTVHQIYTLAREYFRISKDGVYETVRKFEHEGIIRFVPNADKRSGKKMFVYDFAFAKYLATQQPFGVWFEAMVANTLFAQHAAFKTLGLHEFLTDTHTLILPLPFENEEQFWLKAQQRFGYYKQHRIRQVTAVTVSNRFRFDIENIAFKAIPFDSWALALSRELRSARSFA